MRDEFDELRRDVDVRLLEGSGHERAAPALADAADRRVAGLTGGNPKSAACAPEAVVRL